MYLCNQKIIQTMNKEKWEARTKRAMATLEKERQHPMSYEESVLQQMKLDQAAGRKNDFLLSSKKAREILGIR